MQFPSVSDIAVFRPQLSSNLAIYLIVRWFVMFLLLLGSALGQRSKGVEVRGEYRNRAGYAYRVTVPDGLIGYRDPAPAPAHGFALDLGPTDEGRISVDGSYNAAEYPGAREALKGTVSWITGKASSVEEPQFRTVALGGLRTVELVVRYRDKKTKGARTCRSVAAIRHIKPTDTMGIVYEIILDTSAERLAKDTVIYESIVNSFRLDPLTEY